MRTRLFVAGLLAVMPWSLVAQVEGPGSVRVIVRAESKGAAPQLQASDVKVEFDGHDVAIDSLQPLLRSGDSGPRSAPRVEVALLIDDGLRSAFGNQLRDIERFVRGTVSPQVAVGVGYMQNGRAVFPSGFSTEAEVAVKGIRLPQGPAGISGSPYFCLQELVKHWPTDTGAARVVLMISNGIDLYNGSVSPLNQNSSYVDAAIRDAQRAGVPVYSIYYGDREVNSTFGSASGQSYLKQVADGTGGKSFNFGTINPVAIAPYFAEFQTALRESYVLRFKTGSTHLERLKVNGPEGLKLRVQTAAEAASAAQ